MSDRYRTIGAEAQAVHRVKASRFIAIAFPIRDQEHFKERVEAIAKEHHASRHVCYAWIMGNKGEHHRSNDAGEPAGTAGRPILNRILSEGLTYTAVVVVRYFGGTLLGKSGLIEAYGEAARLALEAAPKLELLVRSEIAIGCTYAQFEVIKRELIALEGEVVRSDFDAGVNAVIAVPESKVNECMERWRTRGILVKSEW